MQHVLTVIDDRTASGTAEEHQPIDASRHRRFEVQALLTPPQ